LSGDLQLAQLGTVAADSRLPLATAADEARALDQVV
jgi:hypothetical protein